FGRLGARDAALDALDDAVQRGFAHYPHLARESRSLASVRDHPRFRRILEIVRERWQRGGTSAADLVGSPAASASGTPTIAVLPLANIGGNADDDYFVDGTTEDVIAH